MNMEQWARVRRKVLVDKQSKRSVMSEEGLHWETLQKMLEHSQPPGYRRSAQPERKIDPFREWIRTVLDEASHFLVGVALSIRARDDGHARIYS